MPNVVAILETMWDWRQQTSGAGYAEALKFFQINPKNHSGRMLHKLIGEEAKLLVTNACRELVSRASQHGKPDPVWLATNLKEIEVDHPKADDIDVLLVCGKVAQATYKQCGYQPKRAVVIEIPHPAARGVWTKQYTQSVISQIQEAYGKSSSAVAQG